MEVMLGGAGVGSDRTLADQRHLDGSTVTSGAAGSLSHGEPIIGPSVNNNGYFSTTAIVGAGGSATEINDIRGQAMRVISPGGAGANLRQFAATWGVPMGADWSGYPASYHQRRRFTLSGVIEMAAAAVDSPFGLGLHSNGAPLGNLSNIAGVEVCYDPLVSTNWFVRYQVQPLGALITVAPSGRPAVGAPIFAKIVYTEGPSAAAQVFIDGELQVTLTAATLPRINGAAGQTSAFGAWFGAGRNAGAVTAGGDFRLRHLRYLVEAVVS